MTGRHTSSDVIIVGGGAIGCSIAYYLAKAGVKATVIEKGTVGCEASSAAAGMLAPLGEALGPGPFLDLGLRSLDMFPGLAAELKSLTGIDIEYSPCGILRAAFTREEEEELRGGFAWQRTLRLDVRQMDSDELHQMEPMVNPRVEVGTLSPKEAQINTARLAQALAQGARHLGAHIMEGAELSGLIIGNSRVQGVNVGSSTLTASHVVLAMGAWAGVVGSRFGISLPVKPVRGQVLALRSREVQLKRVLFWGRSYAAPKSDGTILVGSTQDEVEFDKRVTVDGVRYVLDRACALVPDLAKASLERAWAGLRPGSPDEMPILGPIAGWEGLTLAVGHFRKGILLTPITGHLIANYIVRGDSKPLEPFGISRFRA